MPELHPTRSIALAAVALCALAAGGCEAIANAPRTAGVCWGSNGKIDPRIVYPSDCYQTGGTWEDEPTSR